MTKVYHPQMTDRIGADGLGYWIDEGTEQVVGDRVYVRIRTVLLDQRDDWHETKTAAMDEVAVRIETVAAKLAAQAAAIRREAAALRAKEAEADERYDRGLPPQLDATP